MTLPNKSSLSSYGGPLVDAVPQVDPASEISSASLNPLLNDVAAMTSTVPICFFQFDGYVPTSLLSTGTWTSGFDSVWGNATASQCTLTHPGTGHVTAVFPATVQDSLGNPISVNIRFADASVSSSSNIGSARVVVTSSAQLDIYLFNSSGTPTDVNATIIVKCF